MMRLGARILALLATLVLLPAQASETEAIALKAAGQEWTYHLARPQGDGARPLVLVFHGAGGNGLHYLERNGWLAQARAAGFIVAAPDGLPGMLRLPASFARNPRLWNSGELDEQRPRAQVDDVAFVAAMIEDIAARTPVDRSRIYATGHSNGAGMVFRLALRLPGTFAAIAPGLGLNADRGKTPSAGVPTLYLLGTADPIFPEAGGERTVFGKRSVVPSHAASADSWAASMGCSAPNVTRDDAGLRVESYPGCRAQAPFLVWHIKGHGHGWPGGGESGLARSEIGADSGQVDATREIWRFFMAQRLPAAGAR